jgi:hypothetical protein
MAIAPIDLQTLFTQLDKVGRAHAAQREGQALQQTMQGIQLQKKTEENIQQVNEAQDTGEGAEKIKDRPNQNQQQSSKNKKGQKEDEEKEQISVFHDPSLGKNIDISL